MFTPSQIKTTIRPNTFSAQDTGIYSNAELDQFWNSILFSKHSDSTFQLLGKALSYSFISSNTPNFDADSITTFNFLNLTCFRNDTTIPTKKLLHFLSLLFIILHFLIILIKTFIRMTIYLLNMTLYLTILSPLLRIHQLKSIDG